MLCRTIRHRLGSQDLRMRVQKKKARSSAEPLIYAAGTVSCDATEPSFNEPAAIPVDHRELFFLDLNMFARCGVSTPLTIRLFQERDKPAGVKELHGRLVQRFKWESEILCMIDDPSLLPVNLNLVPALDKIGDAGTADLGETFCNLSKPVPGIERFGYDTGYAELPHRNHWWVVGVAITEIGTSNQKIPGFDARGK